MPQIIQIQIKTETYTTQITRFQKVMRKYKCLSLNKFSVIPLLKLSGTRQLKHQQVTPQIAKALKNEKTLKQMPQTDLQTPMKQTQSLSSIGPYLKL